MIHQRKESLCIFDLFRTQIIAGAIVRIIALKEVGTVFALKEAVEKLDPQSRLILSMAALGGYTGDEIAAVCGLKSATVRSRLARIKQRLRLELA